MKRRTFVLLGGVLGVVLVAFLRWRSGGPSEPWLQGKPISVWVTTSIGGGGSEAVEAMEVLRAAGPETIPWLVWAAAQQPPVIPDWQYWTFDQLDKTIPLLGGFLRERANRPANRQLIAFEALETMGEKAAPAIPVLITALDSGDSSVSYRAIGALKNTIPESLPALTRALSTGSLRVRWNAVRALDLMSFMEGPGEGYEAMIRALLKALDDADSEVRFAVAQSLSFHRVTSRAPEINKDAGGMNCLPVPQHVNAPLAKDMMARFIRALDDRDPRVRCRVIDALCALDDDNLVTLPALIARVNDEVPFVRAMIAEKLGNARFPADRVVEPLRKLAQDPYQNCRVAAAAALAARNLRADHVIAELIAELKADNSVVRDTALRALQRIGGPTANDALPAMLDAMRIHDATPDDMRELAWGFARFGSESLPYAIELLAHPNPAVRLGAVQTLYYEDARIKPALLKIADDPDPAVKAAVAEKLRSQR